MFIKLHDGKIDAENYTVVLTIGAYLRIAEKIADANPHQRKRVKNPHSVYSLLKKDIIDGCVIPPIVLAYTGKNQLIDIDPVSFLKENARHLVILDGLQRTFTLIDAHNDLINQENALEIEPKRPVSAFLDQAIRIEFYVGINKMGILYRMLTLNTGQTPMTLRHQVEILYSNYADTSPSGIRFFRETEGNIATKLGCYPFKDMIEGFISYIEKNELPIDRYDILETIRNLKSIASENQNADLFSAFSSSYHNFLTVISKATDGFIFTEEMLEDELGIRGMPFGADAFSIFSKPQAMSGFGAAVGKLRGSGVITGFSEIDQSLECLAQVEPDKEFMAIILTRLEEIRLTSKKIGNAQRMYFQYFFRALLNKQADTHLKLQESAVDAYNKYISQVS